MCLLTLRQKFYPGFTFLELVAAMAIIMLGLLGLASVAVQNIQARSIKEHILVASMLAQEGIELVRAVRDQNVVVENQPYFTGLSDGDGTFTIDADGTIDDTIDTDINAILYRDAATGAYTHASAGNTATPYTRLVTVQQNGDQLSVSVRITWPDQGTRRDYVADTTLYNWW